MKTELALQGQVIAIDGGTSSTRARLVDAGQIRATARRTVGVRDTVLSGGVSPLVTALRECLDELAARFPEARSAPIVAAGMLTSDAGLVSVPHVDAPAGVSELARAAVERILPEVSPSPILFIPGVKTPAPPGIDGWTASDLMRGEEAETIGAMSLLQLKGPLAFLWPGSHTKLIRVDSSSRISSSLTTLAGEITATIARGTLIARSLPASLPDQPDREAVRLGIEVGSREGLDAAFLVRIADLAGTLDLEGRAAFWVGAVIGDDCAHLARGPLLQSEIPLWVGGREPQRSLYAECLRELSKGAVEVIPDDVANGASAIGAILVAQAGGWLPLVNRR